MSEAFFFFATTVGIGTMHVLRMHVTETEETQELRIALYFVFLLSFLYKLKNLVLQMETATSVAQNS